MLRKQAGRRGWTIKGKGRYSLIVGGTKNGGTPDCDVVLACDVTNPLCGAQGASAVYGPQKGATADMVAQLDAALAHYANVIQRGLGVEVKDIPGAGAAGGLGAGLIAFLNAKVLPGIDVVIQTTDLVEDLKDADLVFTGEGRIDSQTAFG